MLLTTSAAIRRHAARGVIAGGCLAALTACSLPLPGKGHHLAPAYLYTDRSGTTVVALRLVQHGSHLTGNAEYLGTVTSKQAGDDNMVATIIDKNGHRVSALNSDSTDLDDRPNHAACGGTSVCLEKYRSALTGQLGNHDRIALTTPPNGIMLPETTQIGTRRGSDLVLTGDNAEYVFRPADEAAIKRAYAHVVSALPMAIQTANLDDEAQYLKAANRLSDDVSGLKDILDESSPSALSGFYNPAVCEFEQDFKSQITATQGDVTAETQEIQKARGQLAPYLRQGTRLAAYGRSSGSVARLQSAIAADSKRVEDALERANKTIGQANQEAPRIINVINGMGCYVQHVGEVAFHLLPELLAAG